MSFPHALALCLALVPGNAVAQDGGLGFDAAAVTLNYSDYDDGAGFGASFGSITADAAYGFGGGWGAQVGVAATQDFATTPPGGAGDPHQAATLHLYRDLGPDLRLGLMAGADTYNDTDVVIGGEVIYFSGNWRLEARAAEYDSTTEPAGLIEANGQYRFANGLELGADVSRYTYYGGFGYDQRIALTAGAQITDNLSVDGHIGHTTFDFGAPPVAEGSSFGVSVTYEFGGREDRLFTYNPFAF